MGNNKLLLVVEPNYVKDAMEIYQGMDKKRFSRAAVLDTEKVLSSDKKAKAGSLAEEVLAKEEYVRAYIDFFLGNVIKCDGIDELREQTIGITADCMLYQGIVCSTSTRKVIQGGHISVKPVCVRESADWRNVVMLYSRNVFRCRK